jgi:acyl-CoA synthetase (AMP-forming)/AMP-acid ligase II
MPVEVLRAFEDRFGIAVLEGYDGVDIRVVDEDGNVVPAGTPGEIQVRRHNVMTGYWNNIELFIPDHSSATKSVLCGGPSGQGSTLARASPAT